MLAVGLSLLAGLGFAGSGILARVGMQGIRPLSSTLISTVASLLPSAALALAFALSDIRALPPIAFLWLLVLGGVNFLGGRTLSYLAIDILGASRTSVILGTSTVFSTFFAITLAGERPHLVILMGTAGVVAGLIIATSESIRRGWSGDRRSLLGYLVALGAAASYGGTNVIARELTLEYGSPLMISAISLFFGVILLWPLAGKAAVQDIRSSAGNMGMVGFAALSGLAAAIAVICLYYALQRAEVVIVAPIVSTSPLTTLLLAKIFIARLEQITRRVLLGATFTVMGVLLVIIGSTL
ncbi:MAG: DMT family transporter [Chloroflexi bacterium]|nr:DMT family transporter [Chloroflexota bacterium]MCH8224420.1 DMT family transporter [Chloroflexota bacterium]MCI0845704.1 DMT family transporter [Chloroflexota bacterium]